MKFEPAKNIEEELFGRTINMFVPVNVTEGDYDDEGEEVSSRYRHPWHLLHERAREHVTTTAQPLGIIRESMLKAEITAPPNAHKSMTRLRIMAPSLHHLVVLIGLRLRALLPAAAVVSAIAVLVHRV